MSEAAIRAYADGRRFHPSTLERWLALGDSDRDALFGIVDRLRLGENHVRDLLELLGDIAERQGSSVAAILADPAVAGALDRGIGRNETIHVLRRALRRLRYPQLCQAEAELSRLAKELKLPRGVKIEFPADLEGERLSVTLSAASADELRNLARSLQGAVELEQIDRIYSILEGNW